MGEHLNHNHESPMATIVSVGLSFLYSTFFVTNSIFLNFRDFIEAAIRVIILSSIGFFVTKFLEKKFKKDK